MFKTSHLTPEAEPANRPFAFASYGVALDAEEAAAAEMATPRIAA
jgi:hypothetical protein